MAQQLKQAMPAELDHTKSDDDFGHIIHACPGILAVRHGLADHPETALDLLYDATKRFSMEFYIRPFLNTWPEMTWARLQKWATDPNYHVRRLVSEGTRPRLPWAKKVSIDPLSPIPFLKTLYGDETRYVVRSVANHLNDIAKIDSDLVVRSLKEWRETTSQSDKEFTWLCRHALRTLIKDGHSPTMASRLCV